MRSRYVGKSLLATAVTVSLVLTVAFATPSEAKVRPDPPTGPPPRPCADMTVPEENHASIRLRVDVPASDGQAAVDEHGKISISGIVHKHGTMVDVSDGPVTSSDFVIGPPPGGVAAWAASWTTSMRPPHLGANKLCARATRDPKRSARILRSFTVVDLIPPSNVPGLAVGDITATSAEATWGAATDNYGLAGYAVTVDGGPAHRTTIGTRSYTITGLAPSTHHTVSVVAVDLAGNTSTTPSTKDFTTAAASPPPPPPGSGLTVKPHEGAADASWHPDPADVTYRTVLDGQPFTQFPLDLYCQDASGNPASPCTAQDTISYPIEPLEAATPYTFQVDALRADGTVARSLSGSFTTRATVDTVPPAVVQQIASESSQCAGSGGAFYISPSQRGRIPLPTGSTPLFDGCYTVANNSCIDRYLPPSGDKKLDCKDDVTDLVTTVAPAGHGPPISSFNDAVDYGAAAPAAPGRRDPVKPVVESVTWCIHNETCTTVIETGAEVVHVVAEATAAEAAVDFLVVIGEGILLGLTFFALYEILFPTPISFAGLHEYPIHFNTNFDTFDNWGGEHGEWIDSLKIFAEVVKTTNEVAGAKNLPFVWDAQKEYDLKTVIDAACSAQQGKPDVAYVPCGNGFAVYVPGAQNYKFEPMKETGTHIVTALGNGSYPDPRERIQWFYPARSKGGKAARVKYARDWYDRPPFVSQPLTTNPCPPRPPGTTCDEFPFFSTNQAVDLSGIQADLKVVPGEETDPQRDDNIGFYNKCTVKDGDPFLVLPVPAWVAAGGPSFGFRVDQDGTDVCMKPGG
jgi:fibronectin type III domain protein